MIYNYLFIKNYSTGIYFFKEGPKENGVTQPNSNLLTERTPLNMC